MRGYLAALLLLSCCGFLGAAVPTPPPQDDPEKILEEVQHRAFQYFWEECNPDNGLIRDRASNGETPSKSPTISSIAATGFGLSVYPVGVERGWITKEQALARTLATLKFFTESVEGNHGFFYHFVDTKNGKRAWRSELSSIDTGLLLAGALFAKEYYQDPEVTKLAGALYEQCDFPWMMNQQPFLCMSWTPEKGFGAAYWSNYNEGILLTLLAIGSPTHPIDPKTWQLVRRRVGQYKDHLLVASPSLFTHQYPQLWLDLREKNDGKVDYFRNSKEATLANRQFCIDQAAKFKSYSEVCWGLTACDGPFGYKAYGAPPGKPQHDGTVAPTAALASMVFTPAESMAAMTNFYKMTEPPIWGKYGLSGSFNRERKWVDTDVIGIDEGAIVLGIENHRSGLIWKHMMKNDAVERAMKLVGFQQGTIELQLEPRPVYQVARAPGPVKLDGETDDWKTDAVIRLSPIQNLEIGVIEGDADCSAELKFMWDDQYLYVLLSVKDDETVSLQNKNLIWKDDCLELFVDPENNGLLWENKADYQIGFAPAKDGVDAHVWSWFQKQDPAPDQSVVAKQKLKTDGFVIEGAIAWKYLKLEPKAGLAFGASPAVHDRDETVKSEGKLTWYYEDIAGVPGTQLGKFELAP